MGARKKQQEFQGRGFKKPKDSFGGSLLKGNPKTKRPLDSKLPVLLTLRANKSVLRTLKTIESVNKIAGDTAKKHGVKIYEYANVGNHIHMLIKLPRLSSWSAFIRELTGRIAQVVGEKLGLTGSFWKFRPHTRIIQGWKRAYKIAKDYVHLNWLEGEGFIHRSQIRNLADLRALFSD